MAEPYFIQSDMDIHSLFHEMCRRKLHIAVVLDKWGGTLGLVTMEDILESLVGDIWDQEETETTEETDVSPLQEIQEDCKEVAGA